MNRLLGRLGALSCSAPDRTVESLWKELSRQESFYLHCQFLFLFFPFLPKHHKLIIGEHLLWRKRGLQVADYGLLANAKLHTFFYISYALASSNLRLLR